MSWGKLCDGFWRNAKVLSCEPATIGFFACCISYCSGELNEGRIPKRQLHRVMNTDSGRKVNVKRACGQLVAAGLMEDLGDDVEVRGWLKYNPSRAQVLRAREIAAERALVSPLRNTVLARDGGKCRYCGCTPKNVHIDHVKPVSRGGRSVLDNLVVACAPCNLAKGAKDLAHD